MEVGHEIQEKGGYAAHGLVVGLNGGIYMFRCTCAIIRPLLLAFQ
jgi:hypothetical protein